MWLHNDFTMCRLFKEKEDISYCILFLNVSCSEAVIHPFLSTTGRSTQKHLIGNVVKLIKETGKFKYTTWIRGKHEKYNRAKRPNSIIELSMILKNGIIMIEKNCSRKINIFLIDKYLISVISFNIDIIFCGNPRAVNASHAGWMASRDVTKSERRNECNKTDLELPRVVSVCPTAINYPHYLQKSR